MKKQKIPYRYRGFTLVELLTVIAIIGILAAILIPTVGTVMKKGRITAAGSNARQIAQAYNIYAISGPRIKNISTTGTFPNGATTLDQYARVLSIYGGLNDGSFWFVSDDPNGPTTAIPKTITDPAPTNTTGAASTEWTTALGSGSPAYTVVLDLPRNAPATTTPILWNRNHVVGTGGWDANASPWGSEGGHIAYLDGHVTWQRTTAEEDPTSGDLLDPATGAATKDPLVAAGTGLGTTPVPSVVNATAD